MSADLRNAATVSATGRPLSTDTRRHARRGLLLVAIAAWNVWLWATRVWIMLHDAEPRTAGFVAVHLVLYSVSFLLALVVAGIGWRMWRESRRAGRPQP